MRDPHTLYIPATIEPGEYELAAGLVRASDGQVMGDRDDRLVEIGAVAVGGREHVYAPPQPLHIQQAPLGQRVALVGYDLPNSHPEPGSALRVVLYWHALQTPEHNHHTFVHLLDADGEIVAQADGVPGDGALPALGWLPGEYSADPHTIALPPDLPSGTCRLVVGLYEPVTGFRPGEPVTLDTPVAIDK